MAENMTFDYDVQGDVLYVFDGTPRETLNVDLAERVVLRIDPHTHRAVGLMVHNVTGEADEDLDEKVLRVLVDMAEATIDGFNRMSRKMPVEEALAG